MESTCVDHPTQPLTGCNKCWAIEKNRRGHISCKFKICTSGSCKFRHDAYCYQPNVNCINGRVCNIPWCGYIHPNSVICGHIRPTLNCVNCQNESTTKEIVAKQTPCAGNCKINSDGVCYFLHEDNSNSNSETEANSNSETGANNNY